MSKTCHDSGNFDRVAYTSIDLSSKLQTEIRELLGTGVEPLSPDPDNDVQVCVVSLECGNGSAANRFEMCLF